MEELIKQLLLDYQLPAIFFGAFFFGETVILTAAFLAGQGVWSLGNVFWLALAGTIVSDAIWFLFGQYLFTYFRKWETYEGRYKKVLATLERITGKRPFLLLLFIKFLYGTRILTIIYLSIRKIGFLTFLLFDSLGTVIWLTVMLTIGWLAGKGIANLIEVVDRTEYALLAIVVIIILYRFFNIWISKKITKE